MKFFGIEIRRDTDDLTKVPSFVPRESDDGAIGVAPGGAYGTYIDLDASVRSEAQLVNKYREMAMHPEVDGAIDDIVNEAIVQDPDVKTVTLNLDDTSFSEKIKETIRGEFEYIQKLLRFNLYSYDLFRQWYIDGRLYHHVVIDPKRPKDGIKELRYIDPRKIRKVRELKGSKINQETGVSVIDFEQEYFIFNAKGFAKNTGNGIDGQTGATGIRIAKDSIVYITSGLLDKGHTTVISYLHKAIKPLNNLRALEDSVVIYRISRAPERRIFYIDVGNLPKMKAEQYMADIMTKFKNRLVYDANTGEVRDDRKFMCYALDTKIPLLDGRTLTIAEIIGEYEAGRTNWVYSCDPVTGKFVPGPVSWAGITKKDSQVVRVTFDNGKSVVCTPDHKFPVWGKGFIEAKELSVGESLIPGYRRMKEITSGGAEYEQIFKNDTGTWEFTHREVASYKDELGLSTEFIHDDRYEVAPKSVIHHRNFNRFDNSPENLVMMNHRDHMDYHRSIQSITYTSDICLTVETCARMLMSASQTVDKVNEIVDLELWKSVNAGKNPKNRDISSMTFTSKDLTRVCIESGFKGWREYRARFDDTIREDNGRAKRGTCDKYSNEWRAKLGDAASQRTPRSKTWRVIGPNGQIEIVENLNSYCRTHSLNRSNIKRNYGSKGYRAEALRNHKVISVEHLDERMSVAALTIDQEETYHSHHTYLLDAGVYTKNTMLEDFWLPRREGGRGTEISTLPAGQNLGEMEDVNYFLRQLYKALNVPTGRLESQQSFSIGRGAEISRDEDKFSKFITRLQLKFSELFISALEKQLLLKNIIRVEEWDANVQNIHVRYERDAYYSEIKELEVLNMRLETMRLIDPTNDSFVGVYFSKNQVQNRILKMTEDEINDTNEQIANEADGQQQGAVQSALDDLDVKTTVAKQAKKAGVIIDPKTDNVMPKELIKPVQKPATPGSKKK